MRTQAVRRIAVLVILMSQVGSVTAVLADNSLIGVSQANGADFSAYLPIVSNDPPCPDFFDDFSNPASGWFTGEDNKLLVEYLEGEYRVLVKRTNSSRIIDAPACHRQDYSVEADARWAGADNMGVSYGLMIKSLVSPSQYYFFEVKADTQEFTVSHYGQGGWEPIIGPRYSGAIHDDTASNHLKVTRNESRFTATVNDVYLDDWDDALPPGEEGVGLIVFSYSTQGNADARFDNFRVLKISK